jgi:hypothetical protein
MVSASGIDRQPPGPVAWKLFFLKLRGNFAVTNMGLSAFDGPPAKSPRQRQVPEGVRLYYALGALQNFSSSQGLSKCLHFSTLLCGGKGLNARPPLEFAVGVVVVSFPL